MATGKPKKWQTDKFKRGEPSPLKFGDDGKFRILHITDIHCVEPVMDDDENRDIPEHKNLETVNVIEKLVEKTHPDLVVFGGDNVSGYWEEFTYDYIQSTIRRITEPIRKRNIPLCVVFGNHDAEIGFHLEFQMLQYMEYENCRSNLNDEDVYGCGNCCVTVRSSDGSRNALAIYLMDSNDYQQIEDGDFRYDCVHSDQLQWYERCSDKLREENGGEPLPSILFQHIPVQQELDYCKKVTENDDYTFERGGSYYKMDGIIEGRVRECPCPPNPDRDYRGQLEGWVKKGDVFAAFFGHDHVNDFHINVQGIDLYQTLGAGYFTYGNEHGGRLIVLDENKPRTLETQSIEIERITDTEF